MTLPGLLASCACQDGDIQKNFTLSYLPYLCLKNHLVIAIFLLNTENEKEKSPTTHPLLHHLLRVNKD